MRKPFTISAAVRLIVALTFAVGSAVLLSSTDGPAFTENDKAYYADANLVNFVRPGLVVKILAADIASDGAIKVRFKLTDPKGLPLDREGVTTPGAISLRATAAYIPQNQTQYVAYNTRAQTSPITNKTEVQAGSDSGGVFEKVADGEYTYAFKTKAPATFDRNATHTIGMWGARDLSEFEIESMIDASSSVYSWVPAGGEVKKTRDVIKTSTCNKCHDPMQAHDERRTMEICVLCHTPQSVDPDTGNTVDMPVMIHKIHMGKELPSVKANKPYQIIGHGQSVHDFSTVGLPTPASNCTVCHEQGKGAAQETAYLNPSVKNCGSCHDDVNFATGENHVNLPVNDGICSQCHVPQNDGLEFDASVMGAHTNPLLSRELLKPQFEILGVENGAAGQNPTVTFRIKDKNGNVIPPSQMSRLSLLLAGPTSDYSTYVSENALKAQVSGDTAVYTFTKPIPADAKGSFTIGLEGYKNTTLMAGTKKEMVVRDAGMNKTMDFSVDGTPVAHRRQIVSLDKCNTCHGQLALHGGNRNTIEQCVLCHNPNVTDQAVRPADKMPAQSIQFANMVHRIHTGEENETEFVIYGHGNSANNFGHVRYSGDLRNCSACHVNGSEKLPLPQGLLPVNDPRGFISPMGGATAACTGCHTSQAGASHALSNTTEKLGEACAACHATDYAFGVGKIHAR